MIITLSHWLSLVVIPQRSHQNIRLSYQSGHNRNTILLCPVQTTTPAQRSSTKVHVNPKKHPQMLHVDLQHQQQLPENTPSRSRAKPRDISAKRRLFSSVFQHFVSMHDLDIETLPSWVCVNRNRYFNPKYHLFLTPDQSMDINLKTEPCNIEKNSSFHILMVCRLPTFISFHFRIQA